jgi:hypothetical protein
VKAIQRLFGEHAYKLNISATKSMTGHLLGGAGAVEGVAAIMAVHTGHVPPTINHFTDDPEIDPKPELHLQYRAEAHRERGHEQHLRVRWAQHLGDLPQVQLGPLDPRSAQSAPALRPRIGVGRGPGVAKRPWAFARRSHRSTAKRCVTAARWWMIAPDLPDNERLGVPG